jgi:hypothetical protein
MQSAIDSLKRSTATVGGKRLPASQHSTAWRFKLKVRAIRAITAIIAASAACILPQIASAGKLYTQTGTDRTFDEVLKSGELPVGRNSTGGVTGSRIDVDNKLVEVGPNANREIARGIRIHTLGNSVIPRRDFPKWSRWYQEDGNTQVFRLFKGETNVRNTRKQAARVEAFSDVKWRRGDWHEWVGTYTIIKAHGAAIFQAKNNKSNWSVMLNMDDRGNITLNHRRGRDEVIARNMICKPFHVRIRDNGHEYEVYLNGDKMGSGSWARPEGHTCFRWGMYIGANDQRHDAMIFVTGAAVDPR